MKYFVKYFVVTFFLLNCTHVLAEQKIVILDMKFVLNNSKAGKAAQDYLQKTFKENQALFIKKEEDLKKEEKDLLAKRNILSKEDYTTKSNELRMKVVKYQEERRSTLEKITQQRADARKKLLENVNPILDSYMKESGIALVIDKKDILAGQNEFDITKIIVEKLDKKLPSLNLK